MADDIPEDVIDALNNVDNFSGLRAGLRKIAEERDHWAGIPMPIEGSPLVIEPRFPDAEAIMSIGVPEKENRDRTQDFKIRNTFYSHKWRCSIVVYEDGDKVRCGKIPRVHGGTNLLNTMNASHAWGIEQEWRAIRLLGTLVRHHQFKMYMLAGAFAERSPRSNLTYIFRKLRPTIVMDAREGNGKDYCTVLCALCLHPIGYYKDSWAGAMCPTDDVIAHLLHMRGDEHGFWKHSNQHPPGMPEAGL